MDDFTNDGVGGYFNFDGSYSDFEDFLELLDLAGIPVTYGQDDNDGEVEVVCGTVTLPDGTKTVSCTVM